MVLSGICKRVLCLGLAGAVAVGQVASAAVPPAEALGRLKPLIVAFERVAASIPQERFDVGTAVATYGLKTPEQVNAWIGKKTALVAYAGRLRGALGVLEDRRGNSLDRALLAVAMLEKLGVEARLARMALSDAQAEALLGHTGLPPAEAATVEPAALDPAPFIESGLAAADVDAAIREQAAAISAFRAERDARLSVQPARLTALAGAAPEGIASIARAANIAALKDYWWVQAKSGETWLDLNPDAQALQVPLVATATMKAGALPADVDHSVTIRVVAETVKGSTPEETVLLSTTLSAISAASGPITLGFEGGGIALVADASGTDLLEAAANAPAWLPRLSVGGEEISDKGILLTGEVRDGGDPVFASDKSVGDSVAGNVGGAIDVLGGMGEPEATTALLTAMWLEVEISGPGFDPAVERRKIFDLTGAAARATGVFPIEISPDRAAERAAALMGLIDVVVQTSAVSPDRAAYISTAGLLKTLRMTEMLLESSIRQQSLPVIAEAMRVPVPLYVYGATRFQGVANVFIDRPNVAALHTIQIVKDGDLSQQSALDVIFNDVGVVRDVEPFTARIEQGVRDTVAEDQALGFPQESANASARFADYASAGIELAALTPQSLPADPGALAALHAAGGYLVFAPERPLDSRAAAIWWRVDPKTGTTLGFGPDGYGSTTAEHVSILVNIGLRMIGALFCISRLATAQSRGDSCGMAAGALCLAGVMLSTLGVAAKALGEMGTLTANWVSNAGVAGGLAGTAAGEICR
jgi:hypothetical protein